MLSAVWRAAALVVLVAGVSACRTEQPSVLPDVELDLNEALAEQQTFVDPALAAEFVTLANLNLGADLLERSAAPGVEIEDYDIATYGTWTLWVTRAFEFPTAELCAPRGLDAPCAFIDWSARLGDEPIAVGRLTMSGEPGERLLPAESLCEILVIADIGCTPTAPSA